MHRPRGSLTGRYGGCGACGAFDNAPNSKENWGRGADDTSRRFFTLARAPQAPQAPRSVRFGLVLEIFSDINPVQPAKSPTQEVRP